MHPNDWCKMATCGRGWHAIIRMVALFAGDSVAPLQIKEKFGGMRLYIGDAPQAVHDLIRCAEDVSVQTCEDCGRPGRLGATVSGWSRTQCDECGKSYTGWAACDEESNG